VRIKSINIMSENETVKVGILPVEDGLIKAVVFSASKPPSLLGDKAVRVCLSQISNLLPTRSPSLAHRRTAPRTT